MTLLNGLLNVEYLLNYINSLPIVLIYLIAISEAEFNILKIFFITSNPYKQNSLLNISMIFKSAMNNVKNIQKINYHVSF